MIESYPPLIPQTLEKYAPSLSSTDVVTFSGNHDDPHYVSKRWPHSFGQFSEIFKWNVRGDHAADLIAGSVAKYASSGVRSARLEWGRFRLYKLMYSPMERRAWLTDSYAFR